MYKDDLKLLKKPEMVLVEKEEGGGVVVECISAYASGCKGRLETAKENLKGDWRRREDGVGAAEVHM